MEMPINDDAQGSITETDETEIPESEDTGVEEEATSQEKVDHEPPPEHPRFKEIYGKMKTFERELADRDAREKQNQDDLEAMKAHNQAILEAVTGVEDKIDKTIPRPDPYEDPDGYDEWMAARVERKIRREQGAELKGQETSPAPTQTPPGKVDARELELAGSHDDYYQVIADVNKELQTNPTLNAQIWGAENPYDAAYRYGRAKKDRDGKKRADTADQGFVEGGGSQPVETTVLTPQQKRIASNLGISEKDYLKQLKIIEKRGGR